MQIEKESDVSEVPLNTEEENTDYNTDDYCFSEGLCLVNQTSFSASEKMNAQGLLNDIWSIYKT